MLKRIFSYLGEYKKYAYLAGICIGAEVVFELVIPLIMADIVDVGVANCDRGYIFQKGIVMIVCALFALILGTGSAKFSALCGQGLGANIRKAEYQKMQSFSFAKTDHFKSESLVTRLTSDVTTIQNSVSTGMRPAFRAPVMMVTALIVSFSINARLAVVFLVASPVLGFFLYQIVKRVSPMYTKMQEALDQVNRVIQENLTAIRVVKAYVKGEHEIEKFSDVNQNWKHVSESAFRLTSMNMPAMQFVMYGTILSILWVGGNMVHAGSLQVGELTGFLSYVLQILNSLMMISNVFIMMTRSIASAERVMEVIDETVTITEEEAKDLKVERGDIVFDHVSFKYKKEAKEEVLSDISFHIAPGEMVGIIGQTGSAKSTLVQLIPRLYEATQGSVLIDGKPVQWYPLAQLRNSITMVLQKNTLFSGTVIDNLRWGKEDASEQEIEEACKIACVDEFIDRLENGYETELGQGGVNVSGGQKQRLHIARAILKSPKVLILDDSTSAVDTATEAKIREGLKKKLPHMTKIVIAQRISSVRDADQIFILDDGKLNGAGTHEELLKTNKIYQEIYESQKEGVEL